MVGNVVVDEPETEEPPPRIPAGWFLGGLGAVVVLILFLLPGQPDTPVPTSVTFPDVPLPEDRWRSLELPGGGSLEDVAALSDGSYVAVGDGPQVWRFDGEAWEWSLPDGPAPGRLVGVTPYWSGAVAVGVDQVDGSTATPLLWRSTDGVAWERVPLDVEGPAGLEGVFASGSHAVAWGWQGTARDFDPEAKPLLLRSLDSQIWSPVDAFDASDRLARIFTVTHLDDVWYVGGYATGRPALWQSQDDMQTWSRMDTGDLPFGWAVAEVSADDVGRVATLVNLSEGRVRQWLQSGDAWTPLDERPRDAVQPVADNEQALGVGSGSLWIDEDGSWEALDLSGEVTAAFGQVAVGVGPETQPRAWIQDGDLAIEIRVPEGAGGRWETATDLGLGGFTGAWRVAEGWVIGGDPDRWWFLGRDRIESFAPPWGATRRRLCCTGDSFHAIVPAGEEWVALPSMHWTSDGTNWEQRARPWGQDTGSTVAAVTESDGRLLAVGQDSDYLWNVAASTVGGHNWTPVDRPMVSTPLWAVAGTPEGFVATAARAQGTQEVVASSNGRRWESVGPGSLLPGTQPPAAVTREGTLILFDTGEEVEPPRVDITAFTRHGEGLVLVAGGRMWNGKGEGDWEEIPLDPPHGIDAGSVHPVPMGDGLLAVGIDRGRLLVYEWQP